MVYNIIQGEETTGDLLRTKSDPAYLRCAVYLCKIAGPGGVEWGRGRVREEYLTKDDARFRLSYLKI